ncbi:polysaccharide deacetylase family protein [Thalassorhabdus alkalitolerans]|uniref:Polysaccharide deacetylase family protein n=1 Tax=Thalassorhabdus alkalitolerans TaxID=2282697 RepID=A0ABW0YQI0_9BACI
MIRKICERLAVFLVCLLFSLGFVSSLAAAPQPEDPEDIPQLEGGPEYAERDPSPVDIGILHQQYPETVIYRGSHDVSQVALTFDDGPDPRFTPEILDILQEFDVPATFFVLGARAERYPETILRMENEGHVIGNHTFWHPNLVVEGIGRLDWELPQAEQVIEETVGYRPLLFRAPYGNLNEDIVERLADFGNVAVGWTVDSQDWRQLSGDEIAANVLTNTQPGDVILMHDGGNWDQDLTGTVESLRTIIPELQAQGIEFVTIPEMFNIPRAK